MRDLIAHVYFEVDIDIVWDVVTNKLGPLGRGPPAARRSLNHDRPRPARPEALELLQRPARRRLSYGDYVEQLTFLLRRLTADLIDKENWSSLGCDVKGEIAEDLQTALDQFSTIAQDLG